MTPDVSVCIANWNCRDQLRDCLASLRQAQGLRVEIIVVDNASTDGAGDMVCGEFPEVILMRNAANRGFSAANNQAARLAQGRYLFFLNNDSVVPPRALRQMVDYLKQNPHVGMVGPRLRDGNGRVQVSCRPRPTLGTFLHRTFLFRWLGWWRRSYHEYRRHAFDPHTTRPVDVLMGAAVMLRRDRFWTWGGWDESFAFGGEDLELCWRVSQRAPVVYLAEAEITHLGRVSTRQHLAFASPRIAVGFLQYLRRTGTSRLGLWLYKLAVTLDAPLQMLVKGTQYAWRRLRGRRDKAQQSLLAAKTAGHFLARGLVSFWRA